MKKIITLFSLLLTSITINAQDYIPMAIEGAQWVIYKEHEDPDGLPPYDYYPPFNDHYFGYRIEGDMTINDVDYKKVYRRDFTPLNPNTNDFVTGPFVITNEYLFGVIRDDIVNRKVYGIKFCNENYIYPDWCNCDEEILMYDFDMNVNDYYPNSCLFDIAYGDNFYIGEIVYQNIVGEIRQVHRIYDSLGDTNLLRMFEGMGSNAGLFEGLCYFECNPKTFLSLYCVGTNNECLQDFLLDTNEQYLNNKIKIYPNPTSEILNIDLKISLDYKVQIFNIYGKRVFNKQFFQSYISIDISNFTNGVYFVKINNKITNIIKQ